MATVDAIVQAAAQILLEIGYSDASTNKIAERAGVSIGTLYEYFPGKKAIYAEVRRREDERLAELLTSHPAPDTLKDLLRQHITLYVEFVRTNLTLHTTLLNEVPHFAVDENELGRYKQYLPWAEEYYRSHQDELRPFDDLSKAINFMLMVGHGTVDTYALHSPAELAGSTLIDMMVDLAEQYFLKP